MAYEGPFGRLELTWTNKHLRLIDGLDGSYEWVKPADWRVAGLRLLREAEEDFPRQSCSVQRVVRSNRRLRTFREVAMEKLAQHTSGLRELRRGGTA